jgi:hypothetical protein
MSGYIYMYIHLLREGSGMWLQWQLSDTFKKKGEWM